jgi:hypothetical protein
MEENKRNYE